MPGRRAGSTVNLMQRRAVIVDALLALAAFGISALVLASSDAAGSDVRDPDALAYVLLALYSAAPIIRRRAPVSSVCVGLLTGFVYAAAGYPSALTPIILLSIYTAAAVLPQRRARQVLAGAVLVSLVGSTVGPGATNLGVPALVVCAWLLGNYVGSRREYAAELERKNE